MVTTASAVASAPLPTNSARPVPLTTGASVTVRRFTAKSSTNSVTARGSTRNSPATKLDRSRAKVSIPTDAGGPT